MSIPACNIPVSSSLSRRLQWHYSAVDHILSNPHGGRASFVLNSSMQLSPSTDKKNMLPIMKDMDYQERDTLDFLFADEFASGSDYEYPQTNNRKFGRNTTEARPGSSKPSESNAIIKKRLALKKRKPRPPLSKEGREGRLLDETLGNVGRRRKKVSPKAVVEVKLPQKELPINHDTPNKKSGRLTNQEWEQMALKRLRQQRLRKMELGEIGAGVVGVSSPSGSGADLVRGVGFRPSHLETDIYLDIGKTQIVKPEWPGASVRQGQEEGGAKNGDSVSTDMRVNGHKKGREDPSTSHDQESPESRKLKRHEKMFEGLRLSRKERRVAKYIISLGFSDEDFLKLADKRYQAFLTNVHAAKARVDYLQSLGVHAKDLPKVLLRHPQLLEYSIERTMQPRVKFLEELGVPQAQLGRIITLSPTLLEHSVEESLKPRVNFLKDVVGVSEADLPLVVQRSPQILTQSIENSVQPKIQFLQSLGIKSEDMARMITRHPQLLHYSVNDSMKPRVEFLREIGMSDPDIVRTIVRLSQILSLSVEANLSPKYDYLQLHLGGDANSIARFPAYFSLSLEQRIKPRHQFLQSLNKVPQGPFPMKLLTYTDQEFCRVIQCTEEAYNHFKQKLLLDCLTRKFGTVREGTKKR